MLLWDEGGEGGPAARAAATRRRRGAVKSGLAGAATIGRTMSLQLHRPDGEGGLEPRPVADRGLARPAALAALGQRPAPRAPARPQEPGDEPDVAVPLRAVLAGPRRADVRDPRRGLRHGLLDLSARSVPLGRVARRSRPYTPVPCKFLSRFVDSNDRELRRIQPMVDEANALEAEFEALSDEQIRAQFDEIRDEIRAQAAAGRAVRGRAPPPGPRAPPRAAQGAPQARERAPPEGPRRGPARGLRDDPRGHEADARHAPLRRPAHRRRPSSTRARSPR